MAEINAHTISSDQRAVGMRTRPDLVVEKGVYQGEFCWIIKDPLAMKYFRLRRPEFVVLEALRKQVSYQDLKLKLAAEFPEQNVRLETIQQLISQLHQSGLLIAQSSGQGRPLGKKREKDRLQRLIKLLVSVYVIRFPGIDPERFLNWLYPKCRFFFTKWFTAVVALTCFAALLLVGLNFDTFQSRLPEFSQFFAVENLLLMAGLLLFTKSIHELGHGLMCKHFGGECHQIGFMLMVLTPAMYCDTSDSWTLRNRWHRMAIGAAGMYVEVFLAAICTFVWWFTHPGWIHYLALNIVFLSSVTTIVFNANPLLRYDGYYILSDFLEVPNLSRKANLAFFSRARQWVLGMKPVPDHQLPPRNPGLVACYAVLAFLYRIFIMVCIMWFVMQVLKPYGLQSISHVFIGMSLVGLVVLPMIKLVKFFTFPGRTREVKPVRFWTSCALAATLTLLFCFFPLPHYVWTDLIVRPVDAQNLVLTQEGLLKEIRYQPGDQVEAGETIATIENTQLLLEQEELRGRLAHLESNRAAYEFQSAADFDSARKLAETIAEIRATERQLAVMESKLEGLVIRANRSGKLFDAPNVPQDYHEDDQLIGWQDTPLDRTNIGAYLEANTVLGSLGDPRHMEAILVVNESDVEFLKPGQEVAALLRPFGHTFLTGELSGVAEDELELVPRELSQSNQGPISVEPDANGNERPLLKTYEAYVAFPPDAIDAGDVMLVPGAIGEARVRVGSASLGSRLLRMLMTVVRFR